jgi:hypothetical protein
MPDGQVERFFVTEAVDEDPIYQRSSRGHNEAPRDSVSAVPCLSLHGSRIRCTDCEILES